MERKPEYNVMSQVDVSPEVAKLVAEKLKMLIEQSKLQHKISIINHTLTSFQITGGLSDSFAFRINEDGTVKGYYEVLDPMGWQEYEQEFHLILNRLGKVK